MISSCQNSTSSWKMTCSLFSGWRAGMLFRSNITLLFFYLERKVGKSVFSSISEDPLFSLLFLPFFPVFSLRTTDASLHTCFSLRNRDIWRLPILLHTASSLSALVGAVHYQVLIHSVIWHLFHFLFSGND